MAEWFWRRFLNFVHVFSLFRYYHPLEKDMAFYFNKFESTTQGWFVFSLVEIGLVVLVHVFSLFGNYLPLEKDVAFILTNLNPNHPRMLCSKCDWNWPSGSWEEDENVKSLQTDGQTEGRTTDNRRSEKLTWAFSSSELIMPLKTKILLYLMCFDCWYQNQLFLLWDSNAHSFHQKIRHSINLPPFKKFTHPVMYVC